ncbi:MAG: hypothetical protein AAF226_04365, partial [Verrucomicrobiota bacterium]
MKRLLCLVALFLFSAFAFSGFAQDKTASPDKPNRSEAEDDGFDEIQQFTRVVEMIRQSYVDKDKVTYDKLMSSALRGMLADLDPHCEFIMPREFDRLKQNTDATYEGIG